MSDTSDMSDVTDMSDMSDMPDMSDMSDMSGMYDMSDLSDMTARPGPGGRLDSRARGCGRLRVPSHAASWLDRLGPGRTGSAVWAPRLCDQNVANPPASQRDLFLTREKEVCSGTYF